MPSTKKSDHASLSEYEIRKTEWLHMGSEAHEKIVRVLSEKKTPWRFRTNDKAGEHNYARGISCCKNWLSTKKDMFQH